MNCHHNFKHSSLWQKSQNYQIKSYTLIYKAKKEYAVRKFHLSSFTFYIHMKIGKLQTVEFCQSKNSSKRHHCIVNCFNTKFDSLNVGSQVIWAWGKFSKIDLYFTVSFSSSTIFLNILLKTTLTDVSFGYPYI